MVEQPGFFDLDERQRRCQRPETRSSGRRWWSTRAVSGELERSDRVKGGPLPYDPALMSKAWYSRRYIRHSPDDPPSGPRLRPNQGFGKGGPWP